MKQIVGGKYGILVMVLLLVALNIVASFLHFRLDLTEERRYTLSDPTIRLLENLEAPVNITLFLSGDMPAGFRKLANSSAELIQEFKDVSGNNIVFKSQKPGEGLPDTLQARFLDSLHRLGLSPMNVKAQLNEGEGQEERYIYPGALISHKGNVTAIDLLQGQSSVDGINSLNNAEALLEYKFASGINKVIQDTVPLVGYLIGNGQSLTYNVYDLNNTLKSKYNFRILPVDAVASIPPIFSAILIVKPTLRFTDDQKLKIDQYIMNGGKVIWMIDNLYAEFDSLQRAQNEFIAFDRDLNLQDQLFRYGVRINPDLVQALDCDVVPSVIGSMGGKPQIELVQWPYFPLLNNTSGHPIAKNLEYVVAQFPNSIDTVKSPGIRKTSLLISSPESRIITSPAKVSWQSVQSEEEIRTFNRSGITVAMLLEGKFSSAFTNMISSAQRDSLAVRQQSFRAANRFDNKMIVISDGDMAMNAVTQKEGPMPMGKNMYTGYQYANKEFIFNCIEYLTDNSGILEARSKDYTLRLLNKKKVEEQRTKWQIINILLPVCLIILFVILYQVIRKRKYQVYH